MPWPPPPAQGPTVTIQPTESPETPINEVAGRVPVKKGQHLAVDITKSIGIIYNSNGDKRSYVFAPPLVEGSGQRGSTQAAKRTTGSGDDRARRRRRRVRRRDPGPVPEPEVDPGRLRQHEARGERPQGQRREDLLQALRGGDGQLPAGKEDAGAQGRRQVRQADAEEQGEEGAAPGSRRIGAKFNGPGKQGANTATLPNGKKLKPGHLSADDDGHSTPPATRRPRRRPSRSRRRKRRRSKRRTGIEPASSPWKGEALPLSYHRAKKTAAPSAVRRR